MNWRRSDIISITTLLTVVGWVWYASAKTSNWDCTAEKVEQLEPIVMKHTSELDVINSKLDDMQEDLRWLRRHNKQ